MTRRSLALTLSILAGSVIFFAPQMTIASCCKCTDGPIQNLCLTIDAGGCGSLTTNYPANPNLASLQCASLPDEQCKTIADGGQCASIAYARAYGISTNLNVESATATAPVLNVPIPGVHFSEQLHVEGGVAQIPYFMEYISGIYLYLLGLSVIAATIVIVYGGTLYILGSTFASIDSGKKLIQDALIGLVLLFSANTILATLNPGLVTFHPLNISIISRDDAYRDPAAEKKRVETASTVHTTPDEEIPIIDAEGSSEGGVTNGTEAQSPTQASSSTDHPAPPPGTIVKNAKGDYVAQGNCPSDMRTIPRSEAYEKTISPSAAGFKITARVSSFCMDTYEAPNIQGKKPFNGVENWEADWYCHAQGKRLCSSSEWARACLGPQGTNMYGYGADFNPGKFWLSIHPDQKEQFPLQGDIAPCNYDSPSPSVAALLANSAKFHTLDYYVLHEPESLLNAAGSSLLQDPKRKDLVTYVTQKLTEAGSSIEPSGKRPLCVSAEGIYDLSGNVQEIMTTDAGAKLTTEQRTSKQSTVGELYTWGNFYWNPIAHNADKNATPTCLRRWGGGSEGHAVTWRAMENGFRCCLDLQE